MITVKVELTSYHGSQHDRELGTMIIDNISDQNPQLMPNGPVGDYRCRMYRKGDLKKHGNPRSLVANAKPIREGKVLQHRRLAEPVHSLVAKALASMNYK